MNNLNLLGQLTAPPTVGSGDWLGIVFLVCLIISFVFIGLPLGHIIGLRRWRREATQSGVEHVPKFDKDTAPLLVYLAAQLCIGYRLLFLKGKLLLQQTLLKSVGQSRGQPRTKQRAEDCASDSGKKNIVCHKSVPTMPNEKS